VLVVLSADTDAAFGCGATGAALLAVFLLGASASVVVAEVDDVGAPKPLAFLLFFLANSVNNGVEEVGAVRVVGLMPGCTEKAAAPPEKRMSRIIGSFIASVTLVSRGVCRFLRL